MIVRRPRFSGQERVHPSASYATVMIERGVRHGDGRRFFAVNLIFFEYIARGR